MKKTLTVALIGILAVVFSGFVIVTLLDRNSPAVKDGNPDDNVKSDSTVNNAVSELISAIVSDNASEPSSASPRPEKPTSPPQTEPAAEYAYAYAGFAPVYADLDVDDWRLILVNRNYILPEGYKPVLEQAVEGGYENQKLDYRVAPHYNEMYKAAYEDGIHLVPISGYRSYERQKNNFENKIDKYMNEGYSKVDATIEASTIILPPGTSEHNAGLAMDICSLEQNFEDTKEFAWLCENAADYGFILRYPEDKQHITQIIYEPWHWRYVGVEAAKEMKASGQCLEEYLGVAG